MKLFTKSILIAGAAICALSANAQEGCWQWDKDSHFNVFLTLQRAAGIPGDFNNDGRMDIYVSGNGWNSYYEKPGLWSWQMTGSMYYNQGDNVWTRDIIEVEPTGEYTEETPDDPATPDVDEYKAPEALYKLVPAKHGIAPIRRPNMAVFDFNNDGHLDILIQGCTSGDDWLNYRDVVPHTDNWGQMYCTLLYKNNGDGTFTLMEETGIPTIAIDFGDTKEGMMFHPFATGDYDRDGFVDLAVCGMYAQADMEYTGRCTVLLRNIDGTGKFEDMKIAETIGGVWTKAEEITDENGTVLETIPGEELPGWFLPVSANAHFIDVNNDGWLDLLFSGWCDNNSDVRHPANGMVCRVYINKNGEKFVDETAGAEFSLARQTSLGFGDFDKDGYLDMLNHGYHDQNGFVAQYFANNGEGAEFAYDIAENYNGVGLVSDWAENFRAVVRDFNADGSLDVLYDGKQDNRIFYGAMDGTFSGAEQLPVRGNDSQDGNQAVADYNGDGLADRFQCGYMWHSDNQWGVNWRDADHHNMSGEWDMEASLWLNTTPDAEPVAPAAPANVAASVEGNILTITWEDCDDITAGYNVVVKCDNGKVMAILPVDTETGFLRVARNKHVVVRPGVQQYTIDLPYAGTITAGVQSVSLYNETYSEIAYAPAITVEAGVESIVADENAPIEYFNLQGVRVEKAENGIFIRRQGTTTTKVVR